MKKTTIKKIVNTIYGVAILIPISVLDTVDFIEKLSTTNSVHVLDRVLNYSSFTITVILIVLWICKLVLNYQKYAENIETYHLLNPFD